MLQTSARLLRLLTLLQARASWTGAELKDRLEVTDRTLRRDVDRLRSLGYPVASTSGVAGGYRMGAGASLPPLQLDDDEAVAVALGLRAASSSSVEGLESAGARALAKLEQVLPTRLRRRVESMRAGILRLADAGPRVEMEHVATLASACSERRSVRFGYRDHGGGASARSVEPHRVVHTGGRWYLVAWDVAREDWRTFRADRIEGAIEHGAVFRARSLPDNDVEGYVARSLSIAPYRHQATVVLRAPLGVMRERLGWHGGELKALDAERCELRTGAHSLDALAMMIALYGVDFEVREPPELIEYLGTLAARLKRAARR